MKIIKMVNGTNVLIDDEDFETLVALGPWYNYSGYAGTANGILMHSIICPHFLKIDHKNRIITDNRKENLRQATHSQNQFNRPKQKNNTSGYKGVAFHTKNQKWIAQIRLNGKLKYLGSFKTAEAAALRYNKEAILLIGEFAYLNCIEGTI